MPNLVRSISGKLKHQPLDAASSDFDGASDKYAYQPLSDARNIRLLRLHKGEGPIYASLTEATISRSTYDALSYTWGSPTEQGENNVTDEAACLIYCNNKQHQVNENLYHALLQFRADKRKGPLWIDAVCIDQTNLNERNTQVRMMGDIYRNSRCVIIWLGKEDSETGEAISLLSKFGNAVKRLKNLQVDMSSWTDFTFNNLQFYNHVGLEPFQTRDWEIIFHFFARRWFKRLWVLQEVVLGRPTNFIIGHHALEFGPVSLTVVFLAMSNWMPSLIAMMRDLTTKDLHDFLTGNRDIGPSLLFKAYILEECKEDGPEDEKNNRLGSVHGARNPYERRYAYLAEIMLLSRTFDAQDHRDRVFAPLSLASRFVPPQQQALDWITPDYSQTVASVFTAVSTLLIKKLPIMSLLSMVEDRKERRLLELPSWVPDFSCRKSAASLTYIANYEIYDFLDYYLSLDYLDDRAKRLDQSSLLRTVGVIRGVVNKVSKPIEEIMVRNDIDCLLDFVLMLPEFGPEGQKRLEVLWRTLVGDSTDHSSSCPAPIEMGESFYHLLCWKMAVLLLRSRQNRLEDEVFWQNHATYEKFALMEKLPSRSEISRDADDMARQLMEAGIASTEPFFPKVRHDAWEIIQQINEVAGCRSLLVTESGKLGLGPLSTQSGDVVTFIRNTRVPFILRKAQAGRYTVVGEAYIHGFMHGEILEEDPPEFQEIILE